jgi:glutaredoxin
MTFYNIYGVTDCPYCLHAQALCMNKQVPYQWIMMDWSKEARELVKETFEWKTYPLITKSMFVNGEQTEVLIGGYDELMKLLSVGKRDIQWEMT